MKLHVSDQEKETVLRAVKKHFPSAQIFFFGSRVSGNHKRYSDLDICLDDQGRPLELFKFSLLQEELSQSDIPYKIDIVDWNRITPEFQRVIKAESLPLN